MTRLTLALPLLLAACGATPALAATLPATPATFAAVLAAAREITREKASAPVVSAEFFRNTRREEATGSGVGVVIGRRAAVA
jgi:hypothetical protein